MPMDFGFMGGGGGAGTGAAGSTWGGQMGEAGGFTEYMKDPNVLQMLMKLGGGISQGQPAGQAAGESASELLMKQALQAGAAGVSQRKAGLMEQLISALKADPTGKGILGPKEDRNTLDAITLTNDGINIKAPNPDMTRPFEDITDQSLESQAGERKPKQAPMLGEEDDQFPFL